MRGNSHVVSDFSNWYNGSNQLYDINIFFDLELKYQIAVWLDYFHDRGIHIVVADEILVFLRMNMESIYKNLAVAKYKIFTIDTEVDPSEGYEIAIVKLIKLINKPF